MSFVDTYLVALAILLVLVMIAHYAKSLGFNPSRRVRLAFTGFLVLVLAFVVSLAATPRAHAATCTTVWLTAPTVGHVLPAGTQRCIDLTDGIYDDQLLRVYRLDDPDLRQIDWLDRWALTTYPANDGRVESTADQIRSVANQYDLRVGFANRDLLGRLGCSGGFENSVTGTYQPSSRYPGEGLIRIGTGFTDRCMSYRQVAVNTAKFEFSRALIERICGTPGPPMAGDTYMEIAAVTSAYSQKYLGATQNDGGVSPTKWDFIRATRIHDGDCR